MILTAIITLAVMSILAFEVYKSQKEQTKLENQTKINNEEPKKEVNTLLTDPKKADKPGDF